MRQLHLRFAISALLLLSVVLGACAAPAAPAPADSGADMADEGEMMGRPLPDDAAEEQVIRYVARGFGRLNPAAEGGFGRFIISHMFMPFFIRDANHNLSPWLATGIDANEDLSVYTIHIHPDAVWNDGSPVTAQEAKAYWEYGLHPDKCVGCYLSRFTGFDLIEGAQAVIDGEADEVSGVVAVDDKTLEVRLVGPDPLFPQRVALFDTGFVKVEDITGEDFSATSETRVNGPFMLQEWDVDEQKFEIVQNPNWWGDKKPFIERIIATPSADENISFIMWQNDEVDIAFFLTNVREQLEEGTFTVIPYATNLFYTFWAGVEPIDDLNVRRALVHAVDWRPAISAAWEGTRDDRFMSTLLTPELQCYKEGNWPDFGFDPELAKAELAASKYGGPENLPTIRISTGGQSPNYIRTAEIMVEQWKNNLGITNVEIRPGWLDVWGQDADLVNLRRQSLGAILPDPPNFLAGHWANYGNPDAAGSMADDAELAEMIESLKSMSRDDPGFCDLVQETEARMLGHYPIIPMIWDPYGYSVKPHIKNFGTNVDNNWATLLDIYVAEK